jgi:hypothetical protein
VLFSPDGLLGLWERIKSRLGSGRTAPPQAERTQPADQYRADSLERS